MKPIQKFYLRETAEPPIFVIYIEPLPGGGYDVFLGGRPLLKNVQNPFPAACKVLRSRGFTAGTLEMWDFDRPWPRMGGPIAEKAPRNAQEGAE